MMNQINRRNNILLAAAIAALSALGFTRPAAAQYQAPGSDGRAHDASNRVGSNGLNAPRSTYGGVSPNDIIYRNVTGGREFRGPLGERDPTAFTGRTPSNQLDTFIRQSTGVPTDYGAQPQYSWQPQVFYGESRMVAPPAGSLPVGFNGGYTSNTSSNYSTFNTAAYLEGLQARTDNRGTFQLNQEVSSPFYDALSAFNQPGTLNSVPVYGLNGAINGVDSFNMQFPGDHFGADSAGILKMRQELRDAINPNAVNPNAPKPANPNETQPPTGPDAPLNKPLESVGDVGFANRAGGSQNPNSPLSANGFTSTLAARYLVPPEQQSTLLETLQKRMDASSSVAKALAEARAATPQPATPIAKPENPNPALGAEATSVKVKSLAEGIKAKGLHDLMASAEDLIRAGKYDTAIQNYNKAQRVAPNNPLAQFGRANAELAGGYYQRAERDLRVALAGSPGLLLMKLDVASIFPKDRVAAVRNDLQNLAAKDPAAERPWFLLAYLDYQTGDAAAAGKDLDETEKRGGLAAAILVRRMRQVWGLPSSTVKPAPAFAPKSPPPANPPAPQESAPPRPELNK